MSLTHILKVSVIFSAFLPFQVTAVAGKVNGGDENVEEIAEVSSLTFASAGEDGNKEYESTRKVVPETMSSRSGLVFNIPSGQECRNYTNLTNPDRAQRAVTVDQQLCDSSSGAFVSGWYRFAGDAGDKMASSCVPILRCTTAAPGWLNGSHPNASSSLARRKVCFHWREDCCKYNINIWVRYCGGFYIYHLPVLQCNMRYCGDALGPLKNPSECGGNVTNLTGQITSPGYPTYMEPISCTWTIKSPFDGKILLYFESMTLSHGGCLSNNLTIAGNERHTFCSKTRPFHLLFAKKSVNLHYESVYWNKIPGFKLRYAMIKENFDKAKVISNWTINIRVNGSSVIQVSWQAINTSSMKPDEYVYGYVVVCKPANQRSVYRLTKPDAASITISGLAGGTEYKVQVVALVSERNTFSSSIYGSVIVKTATNKGECTYFNNLTTWDRGQSAPASHHCDQNDIVTPAWYRFSGKAGTQIASSCVPKRRCGTAVPGWMDGTHPLQKDGIVIRQVCFHWFEDCCTWQVNIKVRNCGGFYVYQLQRPTLCNLRYCGNKGGCGKSVNDTTGILKSPGYPLRIYWDSKCQWNFTAPSSSGVIVVVVEHLSIPISARCLNFSLSLENNDGKQVGEACGVQRFFSWVSKGSAKLRFFSKRAASRWVGFKARYFIFNNDLTQIPDIPGWTECSAEAINSTSITVRWGAYPALPGSPPVTEYIIICVPDKLPFTATIFPTDVSQNSLVVTGLMAYTNYTVQIVVQIKGKNSSFNDYGGSQKTRSTTKEGVPSEGPQNVSVVAKVKDTTITVSWKPIPVHARHGEIIQYVIFYKNTLSSVNYTTKPIGSEHLKCRLTNLKGVSEYRIEVAGVTSAGVGTKSRPVFAVTACKSSSIASEDHMTWTFNSPRYPDRYPSNLDCTWLISSKTGFRVSWLIIVFDKFHLEKTSPCNSTDYISVTQSVGGTSQLFCGKKDPFAVFLEESGRVKLQTDRALEESGFHARVFVLTASNIISVNFLNSVTNGVHVIYNDTLQWEKPSGTKEDVQEYVVLYKNDTNRKEAWQVSITNITKAKLTGLDEMYEQYYAILLIRTITGKVYFGRRTTFKLHKDIPTGTTPPEATIAPTRQNSTIDSYRDTANDNMVPNTVYYSTRCLRVDIPGVGMQFFTKRHHMIHICRNGILLFETPQLIRWSRRFSERDSLYKSTAIIAPYWALTDVDDSFLIHNVSKVFYKVYQDTDNERKSEEILNQATYDVTVLHINVSKLYEHVKEHNKPTKFKAKWVLVVTWVNLRPHNAHQLPSNLNNTFQAVVITDGTYSFVMYNYPLDGILWSAPTLEKYYKYYTLYRGLPVFGLNGGDQKHEYYHFIGSGETGMVNIDKISGKTVRINEGKEPIEDECLPGKWLFRVETASDPSKSKVETKCIKWLKSEPADHRPYTEYLEPCPCTYRQAFWDERFKMDLYGWPFICANSVFESRDRWEQKCCYGWTGALVVGYPGGGYPIAPYKNNGIKKDKSAFTFCCVFTSKCKYFYEKRPSDDCARYKQTEWSWLWGDPHFVTLDGRNYTFNGIGEYIMADVSEGFFQLQARTKLVEAGGKATVFVSAVAKQTGTSAVQVNLKSGSGLELLINGTITDHNTLTNKTISHNVSIAQSRPDNSSITVLFPCGISVKMTNVKDSLVILLAAPQRFKNKTRGLLGVWNDDPLDDLTTPTGRVLPTNATGRMIHYEFGQKWQVTENNTLFTYNAGETINTFSDSSFQPMFVEDFKFANDAFKQEAVEKCEGDVNCLFDAASTNDVTMGTSTKMVGSRLKNESETLKNSAPRFLNNSSIISVTVNTTARIKIVAKDADGDPLTFNVSGIRPEKLYINTDSSLNIVIIWNVTMTKIKFEVTVMDDKGDVALLRPEIHLCACHNGGHCYSDANNNVFADSSNDTFLVMQCNCINGYSGRFCENDLDACQANVNPCYPGIKCTDLPPPADVFGYKCGPCPYGFSGDGAACLDLDECVGVENGCDQICVNTPGSFVCDCNQGYGLSIDQKTCNDIDECIPASDCMQICKNTRGSYTCECDAGFKVDPNNRKKCVPKLPCTAGNHGCQHVCYVKDGAQQCACYQGFKLRNDEKKCQDIDECSTGRYRCDQYCHNTDGSYSCSCKKGFRMNSDGFTCDDVDECMELTYQCPDPSQICLNIPGLYKCDCGPGLYLTANNTCREILPGVTPTSPGPASIPKHPSINEKKNAVRITVKELHISEWKKPLEQSFKDSVAKAVTSFCASKEKDCQKMKPTRERRALDYILYTADQVHLLPGFPIQINPKPRDIAAVIAFYVDFPPEVVSTSGDSIEGLILVNIVQSAKRTIEKALNKTIGDITLNNIETPSTKSNPINISLIIGGSLAAAIFIGIFVVLVRRDTSRSAILHLKRRRDHEGRKTRSRDVNNVCYDGDAIPGEFRFAAASSTDILEGTGNESVQTAELGIDNLEVDVK